MLQAGASAGFMQNKANTGDFGKKSVATPGNKPTPGRFGVRKAKKKGFLRHLAGAFTGR